MKLESITNKIKLDMVRNFWMKRNLDLLEQLKKARNENAKNKCFNEGIANMIGISAQFCKWSDYDNNHLEYMSDDMTISITAKQLRDLLATDNFDRKI
jgi:hypothetical protein